MDTKLLVLRAIRTLQAQGSPVSLRTLLAVVPAPPLAVAGTLRALDAEGYLDPHTLRLTMLGFVASHAPTMVAYERRRSSSLRTKAARVA
jgi:hypothetical protein